jgi:CheY-like chemotaxis protein
LRSNEVRLANPVHVVSDAERALDYLYRRGDYQEPAKSPRPNMILRDLKRPKIDRLEILKTVKEDVNLTGAGLLLDHFHF